MNHDSPPLATLALAVSLVVGVVLLAPDAHAAPPGRHTHQEPPAAAATAG